MHKYSSYLLERIYEKDFTKNINTAKYNYWNNLLGEDNWKQILQEYPKVHCYLRDEKFSCFLPDNDIFFEEIQKENSDFCISDFMYDRKIYFPQFYTRLSEYALVRLKETLVRENNICKPCMFEEFMKQLVIHLQEICLRTLIVKIHEYEENGLLIGESSAEKYQYFCEKIISQKNFLLEVLEDYPVLSRIIQNCIENKVNYFREVIHNFDIEKTAIQESLYKGKNLGKICKILGGFSDFHNYGRQIMRVVFEDGTEILYKPRSMNNEYAFGELLRWMQKYTGIKQYAYEFLSYKDHSWCTIVKYSACTSSEELEAYYTRLGVQLFLTYFLGTRDLHYENLIAAGEYPVLIDLEILSNRHMVESRDLAVEEILYQLGQSVLYTGILPYYHWNQNGKGINCSAISGNGNQTYPFKIPVVIDGETSDMRIAYATPVSQKKENLAVLREEFQDPVLYVNQLVYGFQTAYRTVLENKDVFGMVLQGLHGLKCLYLLTDTQRYQMLLSTSYHPQMLRDGADRELLLYSLKKGRKISDMPLIECEVKELLDGDIPYFFSYMDSKNLHNIKGKCVENYFSCTGMKYLEKRLEQLNLQDMELQSDYITWSLKMTQNNSKERMNRIYHSKNCFESEGKNSYNHIKRLTDCIVQQVVWNQEHTQVSWNTAMVTENGSSWSLCPMNWYFYDGLAGMLLLMYHLKERDRREEIRQIYETLKKMLFSYTDEIGKSLKRPYSFRTGALDGESSIIYVYLKLYQTSGKLEFLEFAHKHAEIVANFLESDQYYDLLNGNAGAAYVFLELYTCSFDEKYLDLAKKAISVIEKSAKHQQNGIGWVIDKNVPPMAGMAHGNSGFLLPVIYLWKMTGQKKYEELAEQIWLYEESLYNSDTGNWNDVRLQDPKLDLVGSVAWCHGASGILLSRLLCIRMVKEHKWKKRFET